MMELCLQEFYEAWVEGTCLPLSGVLGTKDLGPSKLNSYLGIFLVYFSV